MDCIFCKIVNGELPSKVLYEDDLVMVIMDVNPIRDGHILVIPKKHFTDFVELDEDTTKHIFNVAKKMTKLLMDKLNSHIYLHLLPDFGTTDVSLAKRTIEENYNTIMS